jgi:DNA-binding FrmR family transcriptional regulator
VITEDRDCVSMVTQLAVVRSGVEGVGELVRMAHSMDSNHYSILKDRQKVLRIVQYSPPTRFGACHFG